MDNLFAPVDIQTNDDDNLEAVAQKFGVVVTPENEKLVRAKKEADNFIEQLKREADELRKEVSSKQTIDEIMTQIRALSPKPVQVEPHIEPPKATPASPEELETVVAKLLERRSSEDRVKSNRQLVEEKVLEKWGADAQVNINKKAKELGVTVDHLQKIALDTPSLFFRLTGLDSAPAQAAPLVAPRSTQRVPDAPGSDGKRTKAYYDALKLRNPTEYFSAKVRQQMMKDALAVGEAFFDA